MTIRQMVRAIAADTPYGWRYVVRNRVVCRHLDGCCLRGLAVDQTSTPGQYTLWAATYSWFNLVDYPVHPLSFEFARNRTFGDHTHVAQQLSPYLDTHPDLRRVVFAAPEDPVFIHPSMQHHGPAHPSNRLWYLDRVIIQAWERRTEGAAARLHAMQDQLRDEPDTPYYNRRRVAVEQLLRCLQTGTDPRTVIEPWNQAARAALKIEPVARMRFRAGP